MTSAGWAAEPCPAGDYYDVVAVGEPRHVASVRIQLHPARPDEVDQRGKIRRPGHPASATILGPLTGRRDRLTPADLHREAAHLEYAANLLAATIRQPPHQPTLFDKEGTP